MTQRAVRWVGITPASPSARILVPSGDHEKCAHLKQKSAGTPSDLAEITVSGTLCSILRMCMELESLYTMYLPSRDIAAETIGSSIVFVVSCFSSGSETGRMPLKVHERKYAPSAVSRSTEAAPAIRPRVRAVFV